MRHIVLSIALLTGSLTSSLAQSSSPSNPEVHTFVVDKHLPAPKDTFYIQQGVDIADKWIEEESAKKLVASSFSNEKFYFESTATFYDGLVHAYVDHRPVVLSPDIIWLLICQGFSHYVNLDPEAMRDKIVSFQGKRTLSVKIQEDLYSPKVNWDGILRNFNRQIKENTKADIVDMMTANFSTTGNTEYIASQITLMSTVKSFFDYQIFGAGCGIPYISLEGTPEDWERVLSKVQGLSKYGLDWWVDDLTPILKEFINASKGEVNRSFWQDIVRRKRIGELRGLGCGGSKPTMLDGWFLKFMPWNEYGLTPKEVYPYADGMLSEVSSADFMYYQTDGHGNTLATIPMTMMSGLVGIEIDSTTNAIRPKIGWIVAESSKDATSYKFARLDNPDGYGIHGRVLPADLKDIDFLPAFMMNFDSEVKSIPEWFDTLKIDKITLTGAMSTELIDNLKKRFADREVVVDRYRGNSRIVITVKRSLAPSDHVFHSLMYYAGRVFKNPNLSGKPFSDFVRENRLIPESKYEDSNEEFKHRYKRRVYVSFLVEKDGSINSVDIVSGSEVTKEQEDEVRRLIKSLPRFSPAMYSVSKSVPMFTVRCRLEVSVDF